MIGFVQSSEFCFLRFNILGGGKIKFIVLCKVSYKCFVVFKNRKKNWENIFFDVSWYIICEFIV